MFALHEKLGEHRSVHWFVLHCISSLAPYLLLFLAQKTEFQVDVVELPDEFATGPLDSHCPALQPHFD